MKAHEIPISEFLSQTGTKFIIPVYQRNYDWGRKQCEQLYNDIISIEPNEQYFIGSIVHKKTGNNLTNMKELVIIDGQQRITTLTLLLYRIYEVLKENGNEKYNEIWDYYIQNKYDDSNVKLKLKPVETDFDVLVDLVRDNKNAINKSNKLYDNYIYFAEKITTPSQAKKLYDNFNALTIVEIALDEDDEPQKIFQSLNSTGLELSQADLIRNYLLMDLDYEYQEEIFRKYWSKIEKYCRKESINETLLTEFFRDFLTYKFSAIPSYKAVFDTFKNRYPRNHKEKDVFERELEEMLLYAGFYTKCINPENVEDVDIARELQNLAKIEVTVSYPYLLGVFRDYEIEKTIEKESVISILKLIQSFVFRRYICDVPTNALNKIFMTLYENSKKLRTSNKSLSYADSVELVLVRYSSYQRFPTDEEVLECLKRKDIYNTQKRNKLYLFEMLENEYSEYRENIVDLFKRSDITIEHVFPQSPSTSWKDELSQEEYNEMKNRLNTLANLTIVINNGSLGNRTFKEKRDLNQVNSKGFRYSKFNLNELLSEIERWNLVNMNKRAEILGERFVKIWKFPKINVDQYKESAPDVDLLEIDDPTNCELLYYVLNGNRVNVHTFKTMYVDIFKHLYLEFFDQLFSPEIQSIVEISQDISKFIKPIEIQSGYYLESNLSAKSIIDKLKNISEILEEPFELRLSLKVPSTE